MACILVVEDENNLKRLMTAVLDKEGYQVLAARDGREALELMATRHVDLVITDIMMPQVDGHELTRALRRTHPELPILMVTAKETLEDKRQGFLAGTDDYMVKPIDMDEMVMRVAALLRRAGIIHERLIQVGHVELDHDSLTVTFRGQTTILPKKEFYLLFKLLSYPRQIFTRQQLMDELWGMDAETEERTVDVHIARLRAKFAHIPDFDIVTVRGLGYKAERRS